VSTEIEAKFLVTGRRAYDRMRALTHIGPSPLLECRMESILDVYLDTEDRALLAAGYACRRRDREGTVLVTVKAVSPQHGEVHRREELEVTVARDAGPKAWPESEAREKVLGLVGQKPLREMLRLSQERFVRQVVDGERHVATCRLDEVRVGAGRSERRWFELEVELAGAGTETDLDAMGGWLRTAPGLRPSVGSKLERALEAARGVERAAARRQRGTARARRPPTGSAATTILLEATEAKSAGLALESLASMGYTAVQRGRHVDTQVCYDTHDGALLKRGMTLWYSRSASSWRLCEGDDVKAEQTGAASAVPVEGALASAFRALSPTRPAIPILHADLEETEYDIGGFAAHPLRARAQFWTFRAPSAESSPQTLLRVALSGPSTGCAYLASLLQRQLGFGASSAPLATRAFAFLGVAPPGAPMPAEFRVAPGDTVGQACDRILRGEAWRMKANVHGAVNDLDPEFVHDLRVATRRARSALRLISRIVPPPRSRALVEDLQWIARLLGAERDLDVLAARLDEQLRLAEADPGAQHLIRERLGARRGSALSELASALKSERFQGLLRGLETAAGWSPDDGTASVDATDREQPAWRFARGRIDKAFDRLGPWIERPPESLTDGELHRIRILLKRLRYTCEFFRPLLGSEAAELISAFVGFQDCLGLHQDAATALVLLSGFLAEAPRDAGSEGFLLAMGALLQLQRDSQKTQRDRFARRWKSAPGLTVLWKGLRGAMGGG